jgi:maleylpyruvate isomerase
MVSNAGSATHTSETSGVTVPPQRVQQSEAVREAAAGLAAVERATGRLLQVVEGMQDAQARGASALPGWTRGHVLTHLARNADALVNLLTWARTGVEHPMYASRADRDTDIDEGAPRSLWLLEQDIVAACGRFAAAATGLSDTAWQADITATGKRQLRAYQVPWLRVTEVWVHMVDLDLGVGFDEVPLDVAERIIGSAVSHYRGLPSTPSVRLTVGDRTWDIAGDGPVHNVTGTAAGALAWVIGRGAGGVTGDVPTLPAWL